MLSQKKTHLLLLGNSVGTGLRKLWLWGQMGSDGAAVNFGQQGGVIALLLQEEGDFIEPFHCMPHR